MGRVFLLDAVSALAGEDLDLVRDQVDICACTANKCVQGLPGVAFVLVRTALMRTMQDHPASSLSLHLPVHWQAQERNSVAFTPPVQACYALDAALDELLEESVAARVKRYRAAAQLLRTGFSRLGLRFVFAARAAGQFADRPVPARRDGLPGDLHDRLKQRGFVIYEGQGRLQTGIFRVANMGHLSLDDFRRFLHSLEEVLG